MTKNILLAVLFILLGFVLALAIATIPDLIGWKNNFQAILCYVMSGVVFIGTWVVTGWWLFVKDLEK